MERRGERARGGAGAGQGAGLHEGEEETEGATGDRSTGLGEEETKKDEEINECGLVFVRPAPPLLA